MSCGDLGCLVSSLSPSLREHCLGRATSLSCLPSICGHVSASLLIRRVIELLDELLSGGCRIRKLYF